MRRFLPYTTVAVVLIAIYTAWSLLARHAEMQENEQRAIHEANQREIAGDRLATDILSGGLKILSFSADTGIVPPGGRVLLCYGVANATRVKIEPQIKPLKPAVSYCLEAYPAQTTVYRLTAEDQAGQSAHASLTIRVQ